MLVVGGLVPLGWSPGAKSVPGLTARTRELTPLSLIDLRSGAAGTLVALVEVVTV